MRKFLQYIAGIGLSVFVMLFLSGCGDKAGGGVSASSTNVALASHGASITTNISGGAEVFVIDGSADTTNFWQAAAVGDWLNIDFSASYTIESVTVTATNLSALTDFSMKISTDGSLYTPLDNSTDCSASSLTQAVYVCTFSTTHTARYFRFTILNSAANAEIHEIVVMGK